MAAEQGRRLAICLFGPTATGKTRLAVELATRGPFEIISVDSAMVYRGLDIGTGKPDAQTLQAAPHRLIDIRDPWEAYSAGDFVRDAAAAIAEVRAAGRVPLLVGGTFLYFRALLTGLSPLPRADLRLRAALDERASAEGWPALHAELARVDPAAAARIAPVDRQRIQRALEVFQLTGRPLSALQGQRTPAIEGRFLRLALVPGARAELRALIAARFRQMIAAGFIEEVRGLMQRPLMDLTRPAMRAVGYRQVWAFLAGRTGQVEAEEQAIVATARLAKRQLTWLRSEPVDAALHADAKNLAEQVLGLVRNAQGSDA